MWQFFWMFHYLIMLRDGGSSTSNEHLQDIWWACSCVPHREHMCQCSSCFVPQLFLIFSGVAVIPSSKEEAPQSAVEPLYVQQEARGRIVWRRRQLCKDVNGRRLEYCAELVVLQDTGEVRDCLCVACDPIAKSSAGFSTSLGQARYYP